MYNQCFPYSRYCRVHGTRDENGQRVTGDGRVRIWSRAARTLVGEVCLRFWHFPQLPAVPLSMLTFFVFKLSRLLHHLCTFLFFISCRMLSCLFRIVGGGF
jgi:hypothetical protein